MLEEEVAITSSSKVPRRMIVLEFLFLLRLCVEIPFGTPTKKASPILPGHRV